MGVLLFIKALLNTGVSCGSGARLHYPSEAKPWVSGRSSSSHHGMEWWKLDFLAPKSPEPGKRENTLYSLIFLKKDNFWKSPSGSFSFQDLSKINRFRAKPILLTWKRCKRSHTQTLTAWLLSFPVSNCKATSTVKIFFYQSRIFIQSLWNFKFLPWPWITSLWHITQTIEDPL